MASAELLPPPELLARLQTDDPARRVALLAVWSDTSRAARVTYMPEEVPRDSKDASPPRGDVRYVDPRTGRVAEAKGDRGEAFFRTTRSLHRWLIADRLGDRDVGRQIIGAATIVLVFLTLSGLYLRWPHGRARNWRAWLTFDPRLKGRTFLWHLHAISGTWILIAYLVISLTGLQWSYEWYRNGLMHLSGAQPARPRGEPAIESADRQPSSGIERYWRPFGRVSSTKSAPTGTRWSRSSYPPRLPRRCRSATSIPILGTSGPTTASRSASPTVRSSATRATPTNPSATA